MADRSCFISHETEVFIPCHIVTDDGGTEGRGVGKAHGEAVR